MLLTELIDELIKYSDLKEFQSEMRATNAMLNQACFMSSTLVMVENARARLLATPFALNLLASQGAQATQYSVQQLSTTGGAPGSSTDALGSIFLVKRIEGDQPSTQSAAWDEGCIRAVDFGMGLETDGVRKTTLTSCSCQFPTSYG